MRCVLGVDARYHFFNNKGKRVKQPVDFKEWSSCQPSQALLEASTLQNKLAVDLKLLDALAQLQQVRSLLVLNKQPKLIGNTGELYLIRSKIALQDEMIQRLNSELINLPSSLKQQFTHRIQVLEADRQKQYDQYMKLKEAIQGDTTSLADRVAEVNQLETTLGQVLIRINEGQTELQSLNDQLKSILETNTNLVNRVKTLETEAELEQALTSLNASQVQLETLLTTIGEKQAEMNKFMTMKANLIKDLFSYKALVSNMYLKLLQEHKMFMVSDAERAKLVSRLQTIHDQLAKDIETLKTTSPSTSTLERLDDLYTSMQACKYDKAYDLCIADILLKKINSK